MKLLFIGDIVAKPGRDAVIKILPQAKEENSIDYVIANVENLAHGKGVTEDTLSEMQGAGVDFFTGGDHIFWQKDVDVLFDKFPLVRPANYPKGASGVGYAIYPCANGTQLLIINLLGRTSFGGPYSYLEDPFKTCEQILSQYDNEHNMIRLIDFHAEATSEKYAFAFYFDGKVDAIVGTHTHVPTCDQRTLDNGTVFVTDAGMTGNIDSVLGVKTKIIQDLFLTAQNQRFEWEDTGKKAFRSVIIDTEEKSIVRYDKYLP